MADLPLMDLWMEEIISQLPAKALARFKCVSKSWSALITRLLNPTVLLKYEVTNEGTAEIETRFAFFTADEDGDSHFEHLDHPRFGREVMIHGHSHGIICLSHGDFRDICLYNPLTSELHHLPPSFLLSPHPSNSGLDSMTDGIGFGYDPECGDFKVVRVVGYYGEFGMIGIPTAEVYDLGEDRWREIKTPVSVCIDRLDSFEMYYQGFYYWWGTDNSGSELIFWFDLSKEVFGNILMPDAREYSKSRALRVLNGSIVLLNVPTRGHEKSFDVWEIAKDELGSSFSWTKLFTIGPVFGIHRPIEFVGSDQLLMVDEEGQLVLCNIFNTQHCKQLPIKSSLHTIEAAPFVKTLLSLQGGDC